MKVLIVDDSQKVAKAVKHILEFEGHEVQLASNRVDGYLTYFDFLPDLVITDIQMPGGIGPEMINHIREHDPLVKTIYMSGNLDRFYPLLREEKMRYPITFLDKPFSEKELMGRISEFSI
jgi:DNA-binding NtrC family response regulator